MLHLEVETLGMRSAKDHYQGISILPEFVRKRTTEFHANCVHSGLIGGEHELSLRIKCCTQSNSVLRIRLHEAGSQWGNHVQFCVLRMTRANCGYQFLLSLIVRFVQEQVVIAILEDDGFSLRLSLADAEGLPLEITSHINNPTYSK